MARIIICMGCGKEGLHAAHGLCKTCYMKRWHKKNREHEWEYRQAYHAKHREERNAQSLAYYYEHREERNEKNREYREEHKEEIQENQRFYREGKREELRKKARQYYWEHREEILKSRQQQRPKYRGFTRRWERENPEKVKAKKHRRRAREASVPSTLTAEQIAQLYAIGRCFYCGKPTHLTLDHFVPIVKGGGTTKANIILACRECNSSKHTKLPQEILAQLDFIESISALK